MKKELTSAQVERQVTRRNGKYSKMNPCQACGKGCGARYFSDERCNHVWKGLGLVLCAKCCTKLSEMTDEEGQSFWKGR
jgi:hypothetical protein